LEDVSIAIPQGLLKVAALPEPSAYPALPDPAIVVTIPDPVILRIKLSSPVMNTLPDVSTTRSLSIAANVAEETVPSIDPEAPVPAKVMTNFVLMTWVGVELGWIEGCRDG